MRTLACATAAVVAALVLVSVVRADVDLLNRSDLCDVCEIVADELTEILKATARKHEVLEIGGRMDASGTVRPKNKVKYRKSEVRLLEAIDQVCPRMDDYRTNYWNKDLPKFVRKSEEARKGGEEADMFQLEQVEGNSAREMMEGIRDAIVSQFGHMAEDHTELKVACSKLLEAYEDEVSEWYKGEQTEGLKRVLCVDILRSQGHRCYYYDIAITREYLDKDMEEMMNRAREEDAEAKSKADKAKAERRKLNEERARNATARMEAALERDKKLEAKRIKALEKRKAELERQKRELEDAAKAVEQEAIDAAERLKARAVEEEAWRASLRKAEADGNASPPACEGEGGSCDALSGGAAGEAASTTVSDTPAAAETPSSAETAGDRTEEKKDDTKDAIAMEIEAALQRAKQRYEELKASGADEKTLRRFKAAFEALSDD